MAAPKKANVAAAAAKGAAKPKAAPKVKAPAAPVEEEKIVIINTEAVEAAMAEGDALQAAKDLIAQTEETFFTLGGVLAHIYHEGLFTQANNAQGQPYENFASYVEGELNLQYRTAMQHIDIYTKFTAANVDETVLTQISWTKARELARAVTTENVEELIAFAAEHTREEVIEHVKTNFVNADGRGSGTGAAREKVQKTDFKFRLFGDQAVTAQAALDAAKERAGTDDPNAAFHLMVTEWASLTDAVETTLEDELARISAKFGVDINLGDVTQEEAAAA